ncbi:phage tail-collar fiber domain-containing protein [Paenibacillus eucommiae]|uniref:Phage-related tail fiber protein n=1 Tax=Paenibacillus eucommiae TaxID=1355755 RepID=A0ABS4IWX3_9BACL|nr:phage tail protein [Paenibacillus eucommiae]MBP1991034.1 phage-related tail fiber protein [Paenibacillus eucommiae]
MPSMPYIPSMPTVALITNIGLAKLASATPLEQITITHLAVGDGGGGFPALTPIMTALANEVWRGSASPPIRKLKSPNVLIFKAVIPPEAGGFTVREQAIFDAEGDMIAIGQTAAVERPSPDVAVGDKLIVRFHLSLENTSQADLIVQDAAWGQWPSCSTTAPCTRSCGQCEKSGQPPHDK